MEHIFICYSRKDQALALQLKEALKSAGKTVWIDVEDLPASSIWRVEIQSAITESIAFVYLVTNNSFESEYCQKEFEFASQLNKRIFPILLQGIADKDVPKGISSSQWLRWDKPERDLPGLNKLIKDIETNHEWVRFHTRLQIELTEWESNGRDDSDLLHGKELERIEKIFIANLGQEPLLVDPQIQFIKNSRNHENIIIEEKKKADKHRRNLVASIFGVALCAILAISGFIWTGGQVGISNYSAQRANATAKAEATRAEAEAITRATAQARAEEQKNIANAGQLADQAESIRGQSPIVSFLLSIEAFKLFDNFQTRSTLMNNKAAYPQILRFISNPNVSKSNKSYIGAIAVSGDGKIIAFAIDDTIVLQDTESGQQLRTLALPPRNANGDRNYVYGLAFSPDSKILASDSAEGEVILWDIDSGLISRKLIGHEEGALVRNLAFNSNGQMFASSSQNDDMLIVWDVFTGKTLCNINTYGEARGLFFIPQTNKFVTSTYVSIPPDSQFASDVENNILIWDTSTCKSSILTFDQKVGRIFNITVSLDGSIFALQTITGDVVLWDISTNQPVLTLSGQNYPDINVVNLSPDGKTLAVGYRNGDISLQNITSGKPAYMLNRSAEDIGTLLFSPSGNALISISYNEEYAVLWNLYKKQNTNVLTGDVSNVMSVAFSPDGNILASWGKTSIILWDISTGKQICTLDGHTKEIIDVAFESDGTFISTKLLHKETLTWDPYTCQQIPNDNGRKFTYDLNYHGVSPDGQIFANVKDQYTIILEDTGTSQPIREPLIYNASSISRIAFSPNGKILAAGCDDGTIVLWDVATSKMLSRFTGHTGTVYSLDFSPNGKVLASGSGDSTVRLWEIDPQTWLQEVCQTAGRNLTKDEWNRYFPNENYRITCSQWLSGE